MPIRDPRIDAYIDKAESFAQPILAHIRTLIHKACPEVTETVKWGMPHFDYHGIMCNMAAFKKHATFGFWKAALMNDPDGILKVADKHSMGHMDKITSLNDLPSDDIFIKYVMEAMRLNEEGYKAEKKPRKEKVDLVVPDDFEKQLKQNGLAWEIFQAFSYTNKKEYLDWLADAKTMTTRASRMEKAIDQIAEGKIRNWKYVK